MIAFSVTLTCDRCGKKSVGRGVLTEVVPAARMHVEPLPGWKLGSKPSGELLVACPSCPPVLVSVAPPPAAQGFEEMEVSTADTIVAEGEGGPGSKPPALPER